MLHILHSFQQHSWKYYRSDSVSDCRCLSAAIFNALHDFKMINYFGANAVLLAERNIFDCTSNAAFDQWMRLDLIHWTPCSLSAVWMHSKSGLIWAAICTKISYSGHQFHGGMPLQWPFTSTHYAWSVVGDAVRNSAVIPAHPLKWIQYADLYSMIGDISLQYRLIGSIFNTMKPPIKYWLMIV